MRPAAIAGSFYPADPGSLANQVRQMLAAVAMPAGPQPKALIIPHAGYVYSGPVAASAYARLLPFRDQISRVVLIGPAHRLAFAGIAASSAEFFRTPLGDVPLDRAAIERLMALPGVGLLDAAHAEEHSLEVHLPFLQSILGRFTLVPLLAGAASDQLVAECIAQLWGDAETVIIVSSDLSHFEDYASAQAHDRATADAIARLDASAFDHHGACGRTPIGGLLLLAKQRGMRVELLDLRNSGDTAGPRDRVVGYGSWAFYPPPTVASLLLDLARTAIERHLQQDPTPLTVPIMPVLQEQGASFVTLKKHGQLRGCIGSPQAWRGLAEDVAQNALRAAFADPRFPPVSREEWPEIRLSLSLLSAPEPMQVSSREDLLAQLRPQIDGLILNDGQHHALFLPAVWQQLPDPAQFVGHLLHKAGLPPDYWSPAMTASRFTAEEFAEVEPPIRR